MKEPQDYVRDSADAFDQRLAQSLQARIVPRAPHNLAGLAMARAHQHDRISNVVRLETLARQQRRGLLINVLTATVVVCLAIVSFGKLIHSSDATTASSDITSFEVDSIDTQSPALLFGLGTVEVAALAMAVVGGLGMMLAIEYAFVAGPPHLTRLRWARS